MSEFTTGLLVVFSEIGFVLLLAIAVAAFMIIRAKRQNKQMALQLVEKIKQAEEERKSSLAELLKTSFELEDEAAINKAEQLIKGEKALYSRVLKLFLGREPEQIMELDKNVEELVASYHHLFGSEGDNDSDESGESTLVKLRKENVALRQDKAQMKAHLDVAMQTMENMMAEYASMYEGGQKEGEQLVKNEMFKLQQALKKGGAQTVNDESESVDDLEQAADDVPELNDVADPDDLEAGIDEAGKET